MAVKGKVLVIDDEAIISGLFKRLLTKQGYGFFSAENGPDGLKAIKEFAPDLAFCDLKMPGMDGLEVLRKAKEINRDLPVIILTGHGDMESAIQSVKLGAYDFKQKPVEDLEALLIEIDRAIESHNLLKKNRALTDELKEINSGLEDKVKQRTDDLQQTLEKLKTAQAKINEEIKTVAIVQQNLLPESPPKYEGLDAAAIYLASAAVGGDYYDYIDMGDGKLGIVIADVSGHGLPAAFVMTMVKIMLLYMSKRKTPLKETVEAVNELLSTHIPTNNFVTMLYGVLDLKGKAFRYINAGHEPLMRVNAGSGKFEVIPARSTFLGIDADTDFKEDTVSLEKGDKLILATDGIIEAVNSKKEIFGKERFDGIVRKNMVEPSMHIITEVISALSDHCQGTAYEDDITLMVLGLT